MELDFDALRILAWVLVGFPILILIVVGGHKLSDFSGGGRSDYNIKEDRGVVLDPLPSKKSRKRRLRRKRLMRVEAAEKAKQDKPNPDHPS